MSTGVACLLAWLAAPANAQPIVPGPLVPTWGPNGTVHTMAIEGSTLYVGGRFDYVGPPTGAFGLVDVSDASVVNAMAGIEPFVRAMTSDGAGGWFVSYTDRSNVQRLAHVLASGARDAGWNAPAVEGGVQYLAVDGGRLFIAGSIAAVGGVPRAGIAALDVASGALLPWDAQLSEVAPGGFGVWAYALAVAPGRVYVAGSFLRAGGLARTRFAVLDASTGSVLPPTLAGGPNVPSFSALAVSSGRVYASGICSPTDAGVCAYDLDLTPLPGWTTTQGLFAGLLLATPTAVYTSFVSSSTGSVIQALDAMTGARLPFEIVRLADDISAQVWTMATGSGRLYFGGAFTQVNGQPRRHIAAVNATTGALDSWAPRVGDYVSGIAADGSRVAVGGWFSSIGGIAKRNLVAIDLPTGRPTPPTPDLPFAVKALQRLGDVMVAGGERQSATVEPDLVAFSTATGALLPWSLTSDSSISALATDGRQLYIGGGFSALSGASRPFLASVDLQTATLTSWNPQVSGWVSRLTPWGGALYAVGGFYAVAGAGRFGAAAFATNSGALLPFNPIPEGSISGLGFYGDRVLLSGMFFPPGVPLTAFRWVDRSSGGNSGVRSDIAAVGSNPVTVGGTIYGLVAAPTPSFAQLVAVDGASGRVASYDLGAGFYRVLAASPDYVAVSDAFASATDDVVQNVVVYRAPRSGAPEGVTATVVNSTVTLGWRSGPPPTATSFVVEAGTSAGATDVGVFPVGAATRVSGSLPAGTYFTRVRGVGTSGPGAASSEVIVAVPSTSTPPNTPGTLSASVAGGVVTLTWGAASGNATTYVIEAGTASGLTNIGTIPTGVLDTAFSTPAPSGTYVVRVRAANAFGQSPPTNEVVVVVP